MEEGRQRRETRRLRKTVIRVRRRVGVNEKEEKRGISELVRIVCESIIWYIYIY